MSTFANAIKNQSTVTANGMKARVSSANACVDLFNTIGASRGKNIIPNFVAALVENKNYALRIAQWGRDVRGGAGERQIYRDILKYLASNDKDSVLALINKTAEIGRWDDLLSLIDTEVETYALDALKKAIIEDKNGLAAKWLPRKGPNAVKLRNHFGMSPKQYRKTLVNLTQVVETQMCNKEFDAINFSHVPSVAHSRYRKAFYRNTPKYAEYVESLVKGDNPKVKINASAVYPYDILKGRINHYHNNLSGTELKSVEAQWNAMPNYIGDKNVLPMVDVSGSMTSKVGSSNFTALDVAVSLGLYFADKNTGKFKDCFLTFSGSPELLNLKGNINDKINQMVTSKWAMDTNLHAAFDKILSTAIKNKVPANEMPETLVILSDMQFNSCVRYNDSAIEMIKRKYNESGYNAPKIVFWNLNAYDNTAVKFDEKGTALVSGFSPSVAKTVLSDSYESYTPENVMLATILNPRYDI